MCVECGERVIFNPGLGDPPELRLVCTVCLVKASEVSDDIDRVQSAPRP